MIDADKVKTVLIVDDHAVVRDGLRYALLTLDDIRIVGEACTGAEAVAFCQQTPPDFVVMDLKMPDMDGIEATRQICALKRSIKIIILTQYTDNASIRGVLDAGAFSVLTKDIEGSYLVNAIRESMQNNPILSQSAIGALVPAAQDSNRLIEELSDREIQILKMIADGQSDEEVGNALHITRNTVRYHVGNVLSKFGAANRTEAVGIAIRSGLIE